MKPDLDIFYIPQASDSDLHLSEADFSSDAELEELPAESPSSIPNLMKEIRPMEGSKSTHLLFAPVSFTKEVDLVGSDQLHKSASLTLEAITPRARMISPRIEVEVDEIFTASATEATCTSGRTSTLEFSASLSTSRRPSAFSPGRSPVACFGRPLASPQFLPSPRGAKGAKRLSVSGSIKTLSSHTTRSSTPITLVKHAMAVLSIDDAVDAQRENYGN
ncbi:hypothetical protein J8273_0400 [Carpediemonas membranifera]|uniref:Uncharacterized protein n=1 Tax=Carpediemonas membranifera TaxID=201153 RepID=A0A8J6AXX2_9EUKA|nr:hypothetical protein J8273_0400 [Carpediemonas membranifera]|eukprot:KAG9395180.1 hypothetical protein J8273_0400 [Carpediemonas membranifera]